ncbi:hypothetical protein Hanom_Chr05g00408251 [Helianthus anomalus]
MCDHGFRNRFGPAGSTGPTGVRSLSRSGLAIFSKCQKFGRFDSISGSRFNRFGRFNLQV